MKRILLALLCAVPVFGQVAVAPSVIPHITFVNGAGLPCAGCKLSTFVAGTTTGLATYTDASGTSTNTNPITLDAAGGANIWVGANSYKFILKDALGATIWSVDQVNAGNLFPCSTPGAIQIANSAGTGLTCDPTITINTTTHVVSFGTLPANHVTIVALGTPTSWTLDTTSPATACASIGCSSTTGTVTTVSVVPANGVSGTVATDTTTPAITLTLGAITPSSVAVAGGTALSDNQGTGVKVQHSTGTFTAGNGVKYDATGNTIDAGSPYPGGTPRTCNANGCYRIEGDGTIEQWGTLFCGSNSCTVTFPITFTTTTNLSFTATISGTAPNVTTVSSSVGITTAVLSSTGVVNVGGAGSAYTGGGTYHWRAIGI